MVLPILKGGVSLACLSRAVRANVPSSSYPLMHAPFVLPQVSSLHLFPDLGARYPFLWVRSRFSQAGWQFVRLTHELISMSSSPCYIVPVHPLVAPGRLPGEYILTRRPALPLAAPYASSPYRRNGMVHRLYRSHSETRPASGACRCLRASAIFPFFVDSNLISGPLGPSWRLPPLLGAPRSTTSGS